MPFLSLWFYFAVFLLLVLYYGAPVRARWMVLLGGSLILYCAFSGMGILVLGFTVLVSYTAGLLLKKGKRRRTVLAVSIAAVLLPFAAGRFFPAEGPDFLRPLGIAYFTLQVIAYLADIYRGETEPERNLARYALFVSFFPQVIQGPIPRYGQLGRQLSQDVRFDEGRFTKGFQRILWGFFLKLMIADKAGVIVDTIFDNWEIYTGSYVLLGGILYNIQLYTDFMACVCMARGIASLFGLELADNFNRPFFSDSMKEFWGRWHISVSSWLRDYIYIPLGGSRKGRIRKWLHLLAAFAVSGIWHGIELKYLAWGLLHAFYQIGGELTKGIRKKAYGLLKIEETSFLAGILKKGSSFFLVALAFILFRAGSLRAGLHMLASLFTVHNPWVLLNDSIFELGLDIKECMVLFLAILLLLAVSLRQRRQSVGQWLSAQHLLLRWPVYIAGILIIVVYGTYGFGFHAQDFIYRGF